MPGHDNIAAPHADRYGHPEAVNRMTLRPESYDHDVAALNCDRYGHVEGNDPTTRLSRGVPGTTMGHRRICSKRTLSLERLERVDRSGRVRRQPHNQRRRTWVTCRKFLRQEAI